MKKAIAILLYLLLIAAFLQFDLRLLFDLKQFALVILGAVILYLPGLRKGERFVMDWGLAGQNALWGSMIQTFVLLFTEISIGGTQQEMLQKVTLACRPLLYGFCLWIIFNAKSGEEKITEESREMSSVSQETDGFRVDTVRRILEERGLTKRETEVALLVLKRMSNAEIAAELFISETTVKKHLTNIFAKLEINKRDQMQEILRK